LLVFKEALHQKDLETIKSISHQVRPLIADNGMVSLDRLLIDLENVNAWDSQVEREIEKVITIIRAKLSEYAKIER